MALFSSIRRTIRSLKFIRRYHVHIVLAGMVGLLILFFPSKVLSQASGPSMFYSYASINMSMDQCKQEAYNKIASILQIAATAQVSGVIQATTNGVFGSGSGGHSAAVLCLPDNRVAVAIAAGPNQQRNNAIVTSLLQDF